MGIILKARSRVSLKLHFPASVSVLLLVPALLNGQVAVDSKAINSRDVSSAAKSSATEASVRKDLIESAALATPAPFGPDILLRALESESISGKVSAELAERAFELSTFNSDNLAPIRLRLWAGPTDAVQSRIANFFNYSLDRLSLQMRALRILSRYDSARALQLLKTVTLPRGISSGCAGVLTPDPSSYYSLIAELRPVLFSEAERRRGFDLEYVRHVLSNLSTVAEIIPAIDLLLRVAPDSNQSILWTTLISRLELIDIAPADLDSLQRRQMISFAKAMTLLSQTSPHLLLPFATGVKSFLIRQLSTLQCSDIVAGRRKPSIPMQKWDELFNFQLLSLVSSDSISKLTPDELKPAKVERRSSNQALWTKPASITFMTRNLDLVYRSTSLEKQSPEWGVKAKQLLHDILEWQAGNEDELLTQYLEKGIFLFDFVELPLAPPKLGLSGISITPPERAQFPGSENLLPEFVASIFRSINVRKKNHDVWAEQFIVLIDHFDRRRPLERDRMESALSRIQDPVAQGYATYFRAIRSAPKNPK